MPTDLHIALQEYYAGADGATEAQLDGYRVDVLRGGVVYEVQTGSFGAIRRKVEDLAQRHPVVVVFPVAQQKIIVKLAPGTGEILSTRRSPRRGTAWDVVEHLPYLAESLRHENLSLELVMTVVREVRCADGTGSWRRRGVATVGRELVEVVERVRLSTARDFARLLPEDLPEPFMVSDLAAAAGVNRWLAGRMARGLKRLEAVRQVGKRGNALLYERAAEG
jgi:hypothetical protein